MNSKASLQNLLDEFKTKISALSNSDRRKVAEYLQANIFADLQGITSFKQIKERPSTLFGLLIASAYAQDVGDWNINLNGIISTFQAKTYLKSIGIVIGGFVAYKIATPALRPFIIAATALAMLAVLSENIKAQDAIGNVHNIDPGSFYLKLPNQINANETATFSVWGTAIPLDSIAPTSNLISSAINSQSNVNGQLNQINSQIASINSTLSLLGFSSKIELLPLLSFPQTTFKTILKPNFITNVQLISSDDGQASIQNYSMSGNNILITFKSLKTQHAKLRVIFMNSDFGISKNIDTDIVITVVPKAIINYTKNYLNVNFDSTDPENPNASGLTYFWNFGDGQATSTKSKTIAHSYSQAGNYNVTLAVADQFGTTVFSSESISLVANEISFFLNVNPKGTYYFVDTIGGYQPNGNFLQDKKVDPTTLNLTSLYNDPNINLRPGDFIKLTATGTYLPNIWWQGGENQTGLFGVFRNAQGNFLYPGEEGEFYQVVSPLTYPRGIPTDIPEDFWIPNDHSEVLQIPIGATDIAFSVPGSYFASNVDTDGNFGVIIKITIIRSKLEPLY